VIALPVGMSFTHVQVHYSGDAVIVERGGWQRCICLCVCWGSDTIGSTKSVVIVFIPPLTITIDNPSAKNPSCTHLTEIKPKCIGLSVECTTLNRMKFTFKALSFTLLLKNRF